MSLEYRKENIEWAKQLRKAMTKEERKLWYEFLCRYPVCFQRQKAIDKYIVDFYCHKAKLAVELDGSQHFDHEGKENDEQRTKILNQYGVQVLRFSNDKVNRNFAEVCTVISLEVRKRTEQKAPSGRELSNER